MIIDSGFSIGDDGNFGRPAKDGFVSHAAIFRECPVDHRHDPPIVLEIPVMESRTPVPSRRPFGCATALEQCPGHPRGEPPGRQKVERPRMLHNSSIRGRDGQVHCGRNLTSDTESSSPTRTVASPVAAGAAGGRPGMAGGGPGSGQGGPGRAGDGPGQVGPMPKSATHRLLNTSIEGIYYLHPAGARPPIVTPRPPSNCTPCSTCGAASPKRIIRNRSGEFVTRTPTTTRSSSS